MTKMRHWIVTRFNLSLYDIHPAPDEWFWRRIAIFKKITLASLARQTNKNFTLMILIDRKTPQHHLNALAALMVNMPFISAIVQSLVPPDWSAKKYGERRASYLDYSNSLDIMNEASKYCIQTRLDNDDALLPNAVDDIQTALRPGKNPFVIDSRKGFMLDSENKKAYSIYHNVGTPFISLMQPTSSKMKSIYYFIHECLARTYPRVLIDKPLWVMNVHGNNVSNRVFFDMVQGEVDYNELLKSIL